MKTYTVIFAEDVPRYGVAEIAAEDDAGVHAAARAYDFDSLFTEPEWCSSFRRRIVEITDEGGNLVAEDIALDECFVRYGGEADRMLCEAAPDLLAALKSVQEAVLELAKQRDADQLGLWDAIFTPARKAIAKAEGKDTT